MNLEDLSGDEALELLYEYNYYIQAANEEDKYREGWRPVCIQEFADEYFAEEG